MSKTYNILIDGDKVATMTADFAQASSRLLLDGGSTPFQVADARHRPTEAARILVEWASNDASGFAYEGGEIEIEVEVAELETASEDAE